MADLISSYATIPTSLAFAAHLAASAGLRKGGPGRARIDFRRPKQTNDKRKRYNNRFHNNCPSERGLHIIRKLSNLWIDSFGQNLVYPPIHYFDDDILATVDGKTGFVLEGSRPL